MATHDLLFAALALQNGFVTSAQLLECATALATGDGPDMPALFRTRGLIGEREDRVLRTLVDARLRRASGSPADRTLLAPGGAASTLATAERYLLREEIGRGGLGRVVAALDRALDREVAVKLVLDDAGPNVADRFLREAKLTARLDHPNIVPVHDFGRLEAAGRRQLFFCMKRIRGRDLGSILEGLRRGEAGLAGAWTRARLLGVFQDICLGVAYAHSKGVIHRDLKPSNVMIGDFGETLVVDWGLAKVVGEAESRAGTGGATTVLTGGDALTLDGEVLGTPAYMAPEQAEGRLDEIDARADVYALGAILYEILTLRPPFAGKDTLDVLRQVVARDPDPPSLAGAPPELDAVVARAMAKRREARFPEALQLHREVQLFLEGVRERERAMEESRKLGGEGAASAARWRALSGEIEEAGRRVREFEGTIPQHAPVEERRRLWEAQDRLERLRQERDESLSASVTALSRALALDGGNLRAREVLSALRFDRCLEAEQAADRETFRSERRRLEAEDDSGVMIGRLDAGGELSVAAWKHTCDCLRPAAPRPWTFRFDRTGRRIAWGTRGIEPGRPVDPSDLPVPAFVPGEGKTPAHGKDCPRAELRGIPVRVAALVQRDRRLVPGEFRLAGATPLSAPLPQGSYLVEIDAPGGPVRFPALIRRGETAAFDVPLFEPAEIPPGFRFVPAGPFLAGGRTEACFEPAVMETGAFFVARFAVTCAEWAEWLDDQLAVRPPDAVRRDLPAGRMGPYWRIEEGRGGRRRVRFPEGEAAQGETWAPEQPIRYVCWHSAVEYCAWRSMRDSRLYSLLHEIEYEKAARGVDGRIYSYGDSFEPCYIHSNTSLAGGPRPLAADTFPFDESPYGVRGLCGGMGTWCMNEAAGANRGYYCCRGGAWTEGKIRCRPNYRSAFLPDCNDRTIGVRLAFRPFVWPEA
jgi:serine/threonine-protein kinase